MSRTRSWERVELGSVCDLNPPKGEVKGFSLDDPVSFIPMQDIFENQKDMNVLSPRPFAEVSKGSYTYFRNGDVVLAKVTPCFENGKAGIAANLINGIGFGSSELHTLRVSDRILPDYLYRVVTSPHFRAYATPRMTGTGGLRRVPASAIAAYEIVLPPLPEQKRIAAILDSADAIRQKRKAAIAKLNDLAQSIFLEMFGDPVKNDKGFIVRRLAELSSKIGSGATPTGGDASYIKEGISLIRSMNIYDNIFQYRDLAHISPAQAKKLSSVIVEKNDVLLNITGASVCRCAIAPEDVLPARVNQHVAIIRPRQEMLSPEYLVSLLTSSKYKAFLLKQARSNGATREALTKTQIEELPIPLPSLDLQIRFKSLLDPISEIREKSSSGFKYDEALFSSLQHRAFSGEL